ncbi:hypothetical protein CFAM422_010805 [Trichoderma lentiforme]|uniref:Retroviral polymerase SH3-like domain-containing protein n=1 Tax=Trichoderma lentiforme TaxID=1567552 RepID=A0A9P5CAI1_9HYPO|nr:hypothetical protein CFAM422_010805 [Trichoderma lentiforme]
MFKAIGVDYKFNVKHIRTWGYVAYVKKPNPQRVRSAKINAKATQGFFMGIEKLNSHIYKIYLPNEGKVIRTRDIRFRKTNDDRKPNEPTVKFKAILIDPDLENRGRIIYNEIPIPRPQKKKVQLPPSGLEVKAEHQAEQEGAEADQAEQVKAKEAGSSTADLNLGDIIMDEESGEEVEVSKYFEADEEDNLQKQIRNKAEGRSQLQTPELTPLREL